MIQVINYHITNRCNYHCNYCFGKFHTQDPTLVEACRVVDTVCDFFSKHQITNGRINFAGGEPMLYPHLDEVIDHAHKRGLSVSIVTNGTHLTKERIQKWQGKITGIGISIDSIDSRTNREIGRACRGRTVSLEQWETLAQTIRECKIALKVNTVVSRFNLSENLSPLYRALKPDRIKLFSMHVVQGVNDQASAYAVTPDEYEGFVKRHKAFATVTVAEKATDMENSYPMIDPQGKLLLNNQGRYESFGDCSVESLDTLIGGLPFDYHKYAARYAERVTP